MQELAKGLRVRVHRGEIYLAMTEADQVYVDEPWLLMRWDSDGQYVESEWRAFASSAELRTSLLKGIQAIKDHRAVAYLTDTRKVKVIVEEDQKWIRETWLPLAIEAGLKRIAVVTAPSGLGKLTVEDVVGLVDHLGLVSRNFESVEEARKWISKAEMQR
ncbi:MAG: hypothetical protein ACXVAT_19105 [Isosphaeraceae bacterium]